MRNGEIRIMCAAADQEGFLRRSDHCVLPTTSTTQEELAQPGWLSLPLGSPILLEVPPSLSRKKEGKLFYMSVHSTPLFSCRCKPGITKSKVTKRNTHSPTLMASFICEWVCLLNGTLCRGATLRISIGKNDVPNVVTSLTAGRSGLKDICSVQSFAPPSSRYIEINHSLL